ncbi:pyrroline-5-carboxylate reductase [Mucor mucedo]|uniref:pyrroline-5-carboxylate reductase n=1 Tax=Mucor mucedo TaxID=29922 RepID=UPI00221F7D0A|nr:pyrroline-5-carboxylate reductase [Mucor mucedo]KAI7889782.1 pyrroline-5-carboxylate reductase [Mucor mucedo]
MMTSSNETPVIAFIGGGNMAEAILGGLYTQVPHHTLRFSEPYAERLQYMTQKYPGVMATDNNDLCATGADILILAVKPQVLSTVIQNLAPTLHLHPNMLIISIAAGIQSEAILRWLNPVGYQAPLVRIMPNTPALIGEGAVGLFATASVTQSQRDLTERLLRTVSKQLSWVETESLIDAVTGMSGSGPAYFFLVMEAMEQAGIAAGLTAEDSKALTLQTCLGAARMAQESTDDLATLRRKVTSPNGTTEAAVKSMENANIRQLIHDAVFAATDRSKELAEELGRA